MVGRPRRTGTVEATYLEEGMHQPTFPSSSQTLRITPWDRQALRLLAAGHSKADLAATLGIGMREMEAQLARLFTAMGAATLADAIAAAERRGLIA